MNADEPLMVAYREWRQWTEAEGEAIRAGDWPRVSGCQEAKRRLQPRIVQLRHADGREGARSEDAGVARERVIHAVVAGLIALEKQNSNQLALRREALLGRRAELERSHANLRRLRHSYVPSRGAAWSRLS